MSGLGRHTTDLEPHTAAPLRLSQRTTREWLNEVLDVPIVDLLTVIGTVFDDTLGMFECRHCHRRGATVNFDVEQMRGVCSDCRRPTDAWDVALRVLRDPQARRRLAELDR